MVNWREIEKMQKMQNSYWIVPMESYYQGLKYALSGRQKRKIPIE